MTQQGPIKIFEISSDDWTKGMSRQTTSMMGGIFRTATAYDPFEQPGVCLPATNPEAVSGASASVNFLTPFSTGGTGFFLAHGSTKLYKVNALASTLSDETANITVGAVKGADVWRDRYLYALDTSVRSTTLALASDTEILASLTSSVPHIMCTGADLNEYVTNGNQIAKLILESGTTGNSTNAFALESGQVARDLVNDGRYLAIISDNNSSLATTARGKCLISFWDMAKGTADQIYDIDDTYLIGAEIVNGTIYIIGYDNIYACTAGSPPQVVYTFLGSASVTGRPSGPAAIGVRNGSLLWVESAGPLVFGFGNPFNPNKPVLFTPFTNSAGNGQALVITGSKVYSATSAPAINLLTGATRGSATVYTAAMDLGGAYEMAYAKVVTRSALVSGESLALQILSRNGSGIVSNSETKTFSTDPGKQTFLFFKKPAGSANDVINFEEIHQIEMTVGKQPWKRFELWANPIEQQYQG